MTDIFVSYSREDRERVEPLVRLLEARGWSVWWDPDITTGTDYAETIQAALDDSTCVLVVWSETSISSHWVREEAAVGQRRSALVPIRIDDVEAPIGFRYLQTADMPDWTGESGAAAGKILADVQAHLEHRASSPRSPGTSATMVPAAKSAKPVKWAWWIPVIAVLAATLTWLETRSREPEIESLPPQSSVAVLPFVNLTGNEQLGYIGPGLAAGVLSELSALPTVNVVSKSRAWPISEQVGSRDALAESLGVSFIVEGELHASNSDVRVDVTAVDALSHMTMWSKSFPGKTNDLYRLQQDIVTDVARLVSASLSPEDRKRIARGGPPARAFDFYLQGLERLDQIDNPRHAEFAADLFRQAIRIDGEVGIFHAALSDAIWVQFLGNSPEADPAEAEAEARRALELDAGLPQAHVALARASRAQGQVAESVAELRPILAKHPKADEAFRELAHSYEAAGDTTFAADCYETATVLGPDNWYNWNALGVFQARQADFEEASASLNKAAELASESVVWPLLNLVGVRILADDSAGAIEAYEASGIETSNTDLASNVATAYYYERRYDDAVRMYRRAIELDPIDHVNHRNLGDALLIVGRTEEARQEFQEALELLERDLDRSPRNNELLATRALYAAKMSDCAKAALAADELQPLLGDSWQDHLHLAMAYAMCNRHEDALVEVRAVMDMGFPGPLMREQAELRALAEDPEFLDITSN